MPTGVQVCKCLRTYQCMGRDCQVRCIEIRGTVLGLSKRQGDVQLPAEIRLPSIVHLCHDYRACVKTSQCY
jgi:hypothetical protein